MRDGLHAAHVDTIKVRHNDLDAFETALKKPRRAVCPGLGHWSSRSNSMDGDVAPVAQLLALCERYDAMLIVDEAHGAPRRLRPDGSWRHRRPVARAI